MKGSHHNKEMDMDHPTLESPAANREASVAVHLRAAVLAQRIYPSGNPIVERAAVLMKIAAETWLKNAPRLTLTDRHGSLYSNGKEEPEAAALTGFFKEQGIQSLTLVPGIALAEILALIRLLSRRGGGGARFSDLLEGEGISHVQADKVTVVEIADGETVTKKMSTLFDNVSDFAGLVGSLREGYDMIDRLPSLAEKERCQDQLAGKLAGVSSHLLRDLFENPLPKRMEEANIRDAVLKKMTSEKVHGIFSEIGQWYENIRKNADSDFDAMERLNQLKGFLGKILGSPASRQVPFAIYEELLQKGLIEDIPAGVKREGAEESLAAQVDRLTAGKAASLLESPTRDNLAQTFGKLCAVELFEPAKSLLGKFLDNLYQESALLRGLAVRTARGLLEILWRSRCPDLGDHLYESLKRLTDAERSMDVYQELAHALSATAVRFMIEDKPIHAMETVSLLRRHKEDGAPFLPGRAAAAQAALVSVAERSMDVLVEGLLSGDPARTAMTRNMLYTLGEAAAPCLGEVLKKAGDQRTRRSAAFALKEMGEVGERVLSTALTVGQSGPVLLNLLSVAQEFPSEHLLTALRGLAIFPDSFVRARVAQLLGRIGRPESTELLLRLLEDREESVQLEALRVLAESRSLEAVPRFEEMLKTGSILRQEETCIALGKIATDACVGPLMEVLCPRAGLFGRRAVEETVRVRAAWALANIKTSAAKRGLKDLLTDGNAQVRLIAQQGVEG